MNVTRIAVVLVVAVVAIAAARRPGSVGSGAMAVTVTPNESAQRVDVAIGGTPFTSYIWPERVKKPVLDPIRSASGTLVTRGWRRLREVLSIEDAIINYPLPEVRARIQARYS